MAGLAAIICLLGSAMAGLALAGAPAGSSLVKRPSRDARPLGTAGVPGAAGTSPGLRLLAEAAAACQDVSYRGAQVVLWRDPGEASATVFEVWHQPGRMTLMQASATPGGAGAAAGQDPDGILGMSARLLVLLQANYRAVYTGRGSAGRRSALIVDVRRPGGGLAARFWLDAATRLPLRREIFGAGSRMISDDALTRLQLGDPGPGSLPALPVAPWPAQLDQASLALLRGRGWALPGELPGNLSLFAASQTPTRSGPVVNLSYSDGLAVVSLFVQRGELGHPAAGWRQVTLRGRTVYSVSRAERSFAWSADGFVYTLVADAPLQTVNQVVAALPGGSTPGFWPRMGHGLRRILSWINPLR
jgi:sigma-E factor negative regulatory protein RseB